MHIKNTFLREKIGNFYDDIRPYNEQEVGEAIERLNESPLFFAGMRYFFPLENPKDLVDFMSNIKTVSDFQLKIMHRGIRKIIERSSDGLSVSGIENLDRDKNYLFLSNHRDIFLDSGILQILLVENGFDTTEITFGENLMQNPVFTDIGKINKMFKVYRDGKPRELVEKSLAHSAYMRYAITEKHQSIWIAQRAGRTKDGNDQTHTGVLKMLDSSGSSDFESNMKELNIVPLSVNYEYEPCDYSKINEIYQSQFGPYVKQKNEDMQSVVAGVVNYKGKIHFGIGKPLNEEYEITSNILRINDKIKELAGLIDLKIYQNYRLFATNFIAVDLLENSSQYSEKYTPNEKERFVNHIENQLNQLGGNRNDLRIMFLKMYANSVYNYNKTNSIFT